MESTADILEKLSAYGELIVSGLLIMLGGMVAILLLYRLVAALIKPHIKVSAALNEKEFVAGSAPMFFL